jgi:CSLREA domain-containing protein
MFKHIKEPFSKTKKRAKKQPKSLHYEELEQRVLFSADVVPGLDNVAVEEQVIVEDVNRDVQAERQATPETVEQSAAEARRELALVHENVAGYEQLIADLQGHDNNRTIEVVVLDSDRDGIEQVSEILSERSDLAAVHFITHGADGQINLGNSRLNSTTLAENSDAVAGWGKALTDTGDILFYGCNIAADSDGQSLLDNIAEQTGAEVAASDDLTGSANRGGDWELEYQQGEIEAPVAISSQAQSSWSGVLASFTVNTTTDTADANPGDGLAQDGSTNTSLRAAIEESNALAGADVITLGAGTYTLSLGEITISSDLTITGAGVGVTVIDGNSLSRVFDVISGTVTISDLTIQNADAGSGSGGGINVGASAVVSLNNVELTGNMAGQGGAIANEGTLTLTDVTISGNTTTGKGAGLYNLGSATLTSGTISGNNSTADDGGGVFNDGTSFIAINVTISGNSAGRGGGFYEFNANPSTLQNVTITDNTAIDRSGGVEVRGGMLLTMRNTIIAGNNATNEAPDLKGTIASQGNNLIGSSADGNGYIGSDILDVSPILGTLSDNGGTTMTHALLTGSRGINEGSNAVAPATDQRDVARDGACDIGAYEVLDIAVNHLIVTNSDDAGVGSLRQAIIDANANVNAGVPDVITFNIGADGGQQTINLLSALDPISEAVLINGFSQYGALTPTDPIIEINGAGIINDGLTFASTSDGSVVQGLMITGFSRFGIQVDSGADEITIIGNWIGTTGTGYTGVGNDTGINIQGANTIIGGTGANDGNVITNNSNEGINITGSGATGTKIQGNIIGLDPDGSTGSGNADVGIALLSGAHNTTIGGTTVAARNVISRNFEGIEINSNNNIVQGNYIGTDITGTLDRGNHSDDGVEINSGDNLIGGTVEGAGNLIAYNAREGVYATAGSFNEVVGNTITQNVRSGIVSNTDETSIVGNVIYSNSTGFTLDEVIVNGSDVVLYHNTIHGAQNDGISVVGANAIIRNNIITGSAGYGIRINGGSISQESHNLITDAVTGPANLGGRVNFALDASDLNADPLYINATIGDFRLTSPTSPAIDALAGRGVRFARAYSTAPWTLPAHMSLFTGLTPERHTVTRWKRALPKEIPTLAELLRSEGYRTFGHTTGGFVSST